jgi:hypothetical protein
LRARPPPGAAARFLKDPAMPGQSQNTKLRNWLVLIVLAAIAAFIYVAFIAKMAGYQF